MVPIDALTHGERSFYALPVINNHAEIDGFSMLDMNPPETPDVPLTLSAGARFRWAL